MDDRPALIPWPPGFPCLSCGKPIDEAGRFAIVRYDGEILGAAHFEDCALRACHVDPAELAGLPYFLSTPANVDALRQRPEWSDAGHWVRPTEGVR